MLWSLYKNVETLAWKLHVLLKQLIKLWKIYSPAVFILKIVKIFYNFLSVHFNNVGKFQLIKFLEEGLPKTNNLKNDELAM